MDFEVDFSGFDELEDKFKELQEKAKELDGSREVPYNDLFPNEFMRFYTEFDDFDELIEASDFEIDSAEGIDNIPGEDWDEYIRTNTRFSSWQEMLDKAAKKWTERQLDI